MRALIVYNETSLQLELALQLQRRGFAVLCITPAELAVFLADRFADLALQFASADQIELERPDGSYIDIDYVVIDCASRELAQDDQPLLVDAHFEQLVAHCARQRWQFVLASDSRVFPSGSKQRYREVDNTQPSTRPGILLAQRERYLADHWPRHIILRTGPLIAGGGNNLLTEFLKRLRSGEAMFVANAARFCPAPAADVARVIVGICEQLGCNVQCWGIYHYHSSDPTTGYEFAEVLLAAATQYWELDAAHARLQLSIDDPLGSLYPLLNCQRIRDTFGIQQLPWRKAIPQLLKTIYAGETS